MKSLSRRHFLKDIAVLGAMGSSAIALDNRAPRILDLSLPTDSRKRLAVTSWPFRAYIESSTNKARDESKPGMDLKDFGAMVVKKFGVRNINPLADHFSSTDPAYVAALRSAVEGAGSHIVDLGLAGRSFGDPDSSQRAAAIDYGRKWIDIAVALGSPSVRQHLRVEAGQTPDANRTSESLAKLAEYAAKQDVIVILENDNPVSEDPYFIISVLQKVGNSHLRSLPDFGNSLRGHDQHYNESAVDAMFKYAAGMCHVKDRVTSKEGKEQNINLPTMFRIAKSNGYRGYFSMEFDTPSEDPFKGTEHLVQQSLKYIS